MTFRIGINPLVAVILMAVLDVNFRAALVKNRGEALKGSGIKLDEDELTVLDALKPEDWDNIKLSELNDRLTKANALERPSDVGVIDPGKLISGGIDPGSV